MCQGKNRGVRENSSRRSKSSFWARSRIFSLEVKMRSHGFPPEATRKHFSYLLTLDIMRLQADSLFEGLEKGVFGSVVNLYLFIVVGRLLCNHLELLVVHFSGDRGRLSLVATADTWTPRPSGRYSSRANRECTPCSRIFFMGLKASTPTSLFSADFRT